MEFKDYYAALGLPADASQEVIKRAYRKLARKYHPDVSKEADAEARFKDLAEAYEALGDAEKRKAYDAAAARHRSGQDFTPPPGWDSGFDFGGGDDGAARGFGHADAAFDHSAFFEALFGRPPGAGGVGGVGGVGRGPRGAQHRPGADHHAKVQIDLEDAYRGGRRQVVMRVPVTDAHGRVTLQERHLDVNIPRGIREGQHLRLAGQGGPGSGADHGKAGDLYLEIMFAPHPRFRVDGRDVYVDLPVAPWEAALGASLTVPIPDGSVQLTVPAGSAAGRKLRLRGKGLPSVPPGDLYAVLSIVLPPAEGTAAQDAYRAMAQAFGSFDPRHAGASAGA